MPSEIPVQRSQMMDIIFSVKTKEPDVDTGIPFRAEVIIANPQSNRMIQMAIKEYLHL